MRRLIEEALWRPFEALRSSAELLNETARGARLIDGMLSRLVHTLSRPLGAGRGDGETRRGPCCGARHDGDDRERGPFE